MSDRRLQVFYTVAKLLSFTKAADVLSMTQPAVTFQIRQLEEQFKARLFDRSHNRIDLTDAGKRAHQYAERIFELYDEMENSVKDATGNVTGTLRIGAGAAAAQYVLIPLISEFQKRFPDVHIQLSVRAASRIVAMVENSDVDVALIEDVASSKHLTGQPYGTESWRFVAAPSHPLAHELSINAELLKKQRWILMEEGGANREIVAQYLRNLNLDIPDLDVAMEISSLESIKAAVETTPCIAILPTSAIEKELRLGDLVAMKGVRPFVKDMKFLYKEQKYPLLVVDALLTLARELRKTPEIVKNGTDA
jgi:DNA-binding transcriptional LysR family regulator